MDYIIYLSLRFSLFLLKPIPLSLLYVFSDGLYLLFFYVIGYRKEVVFKNLRNSFPKKNKQQIDELAKKFYRNLTDLLIEGIKGMVMSKNEILRRYVYINPEVADTYYREGRGVIFSGAHLGNWEWGALCSGLWLEHPTYILYKELSNPFIDKFVKKQRAKWETFMVSSKDTIKSFSQTKEDPPVYILLSDQWPHNFRKAHWVNFLNQESPFVYGAEMQAKRYDYVFFFFCIKRVKRGYYNISLEEMTSNPKDFERGKLTELYVKRLEQQIQRYPEEWLWSHKRWKSKRPENVQMI